MLQIFIVLTACILVTLAALFIYKWKHGTLKPQKGLRLSIYLATGVVFLLLGLAIGDTMMWLMGTVFISVGFTVEDQRVSRSSRRLMIIAIVAAAAALISSIAVLLLSR